MRTLEERERLAYISGHTLAAEVLRQAIDVENDKILDLDWEIRQLREEVASLDRQLSDAIDGAVS